MKDRSVSLWNILGIFSLGAVLCCTAVSCGDAPPEKKKASQKKVSSERPVGSVQKKSAQKPRKKPLFKDSQEGSFKIRFSSASKPEKKAEVKADHTNVLRLQKGASVSPEKSRRISARERRLLASLRTKRPAGSLAEMIAAARPQDQVIRWSPLLQEGTSGKSRIESCQSSPDGSIIVFAETLGEKEGPFGSRLVFLDTHSWTILKVHHLLQHHIQKISFTESGKLLLSCRGQKALKTKDQVLYFDPVRLAVLQEFDVPGVHKAYAVPGGEQFLAVRRKDSAQANEITLHPLDGSGTKQIRSVKGKNISPVLAFSKDRKKFYACGDKSLEVFRMRNLSSEKNTLLPENFICADLLVLDQNTLIAAPQEDLRMKAVVIRNGTADSFGENSSGRFITMQDPAGTIFGTLLSRKGKVAYCRADTLDETHAVYPEECRPRTVGNPREVFVFKHCPDTFAVLDSAGNFYLLYRSKGARAYRKDILIRNARYKAK